MTTEPKINGAPYCRCYSVVDDLSSIQPVLCEIHQHDLAKARTTFRSDPKYLRFFDTQEDAKDRLRILKEGYPGPGYDLTTGLYPVGRWWLVLAKWYSTE